jgi:hypothetical protein
LKISVAVIVFVCSTSAAFAQQPAAQPVKMECRDLSTSGNVVFPNESLVNGMACHVVDTKQAALQTVAVHPAPAVQPASAQQLPSAVQQEAQQKPTQAIQSAAQATPSDGKVRIYVSDSQSWEMVGGWGAGGHQNSDGSGSFAGSGHMAGGARPQTAEIIKTFNQRCPEYTVTNNRDRANYAVILDHEGGKGLVRRRNKIAVFNREGDSIFSDSTRELGNSVKDACAAVAKDQASQTK